MTSWHIDSLPPGNTQIHVLLHCYITYGRYKIMAVRVNKEEKTVERAQKDAEMVSEQQDYQFIKLT